jgi:hypothetical protein
MPIRRGWRKPADRSAKNDVDVHAYDRGDYCSSGESSNLATQQELGLLPHQRSERDHIDYSISVVCSPALMNPATKNPIEW